MKQFLSEYKNNFLFFLVINSFIICLILGLYSDWLSADELPCKDPNLKQISETIKDIKSIFRHPDAMYIHLQNDELKNIEEKAKWDETFKIYLKMN